MISKKVNAKNIERTTKFDWKTQITIASSILEIYVRSKEDRTRIRVEKMKTIITFHCDN